MAHCAHIITVLMIVIYYDISRPLDSLIINQSGILTTSSTLTTALEFRACACAHISTFADFSDTEVLYRMIGIIDVNFVCIIIGITPKVSQQTNIPVTSHMHRKPITSLTGTFIGGLTDGNVVHTSRFTESVTEPLRSIIRGIVDRKAMHSSRSRGARTITVTIVQR